MSFYVIYCVVLENHSVQNSPWGEGVYKQLMVFIVWLTLSRIMAYSNCLILYDKGLYMRVDNLKHSYCPSCDELTF